MDDYDEQYENMEKMQSGLTNRFESPESIARHILEHEISEAQVVNSDSPRANLNPNELRTARCIGDLIGEIEYGQEICGWEGASIESTKKFMKGKLATTNVPSRSKDGFAITMAKTDKHIQTADVNQFAGSIAEHFNENNEQSLLSKIPILGGFLKKKEQVGATNG